MQHSTYKDTTFHITYFAFQSHHVWNGNIHITPHFTYTDITPHFTSNHSTAPHLGTPFHAMHITTFKYKFHITLFQWSFHITPPCLIWRHQTIPHFSVFHNHVSHLHTTIFHMYHTIIPHRITTFLIWHCMTCSITPYRTYSTSVAPYSTSQPHWNI